MDGKLELNMPRPIDQILKRIVGPMVKRVVASRDDMKEINHDEWDWGRLESESCLLLRMVVLRVSRANAC